MRIRGKIVLPFTVLFLVTILAVTFLAARATARIMDERIQSQMSELAAVLSQAGFAGNPVVLQKVKTMVGGDLATVDDRGGILATTLAEGPAQALEQHLKASPPVAEEGVPPTQLLRLDGALYRAAYAPISAPHWHQGEAFIYLLTPEEDVQAATRRAARPILVAAACGAAVVAALGILVGRAIARPVQSLVAQARALAAGDSRGRLEVGTRDEVGELAEAFNALLASLREAEAKVVAAERLAAVGQVAAGIAHEVRNPLSGIKMSAQLLGRRLREHGAPGDESVDIMLAEIARLEVIIDDLLTFAGPTRLACEPVDLNAVVGEVLDFMARQLDHAGIAVARQLDEGLPPVPLDPRRIRQVVLNLVLNAAEAMPTGGTLTVRTRAADRELAADFDDTGQGIPPEAASRIFAPFFTTKRGGSGLGLGVSRTIIEAHGGTLTFRAIDGGTRFTFTIPRPAGEAEYA